MGRSCGRSLGLWWLVAAWVAVEALAAATAAGADEGREVVAAPARRRHAYAAMMYMGTPRDYEFYVATRVMMRPLRRFSANADRVVIASLDLPLRWVQTLYARTPIPVTLGWQALDRWAIERKSRLRDAAARQQIQWTEDSSQSVDPTTSVQTEQGIPQSTPPTQETLTVVASGPGLAQVVASTTTCLVEGKLKASSSPSDCSLQTPSKPNDPALADVVEKKVSSSIEQIEKIVSRNLKRAPKAAQPSKTAVQRHTLMSMR